MAQLQVNASSMNCTECGTGGPLYRGDIVMYSIICHKDLFSPEPMPSMIMLLTRWLDLLFV